MHSINQKITFLDEKKKDLKEHLNEDLAGYSRNN